MIVCAVVPVMPSSVRFDHDMLIETGQHVITSPDIKGFCIVGAIGGSAEHVEREALDMLALIVRMGLPFEKVSAAREVA